MHLVSERGDDLVKSKLHLPFVATPGESDVSAADAAARDLFIAAWLSHPLQQRRNCREDARLTAAALWMCRDMAARAEAGTLRGDLHRDSLGRNANERVRAYYPLPDSYEDHLNYVESVAIADIRHYDAAYTLGMLLDSPSHHDHVVGAGGFFGAQTRWGCAFVIPAFYVVITAPEIGG